MPDLPAVHPNRPFYVVASVLLVAVLACWPLAARLDESVNRHRQLYQDLLRMQQLQFEGREATGSFVVPLEVSSGESVTIGEHEFTASPGVTVSARSDAGELCVKASNDSGDTSPWDCVSAPPPPSEIL